MCVRRVSFQPTTYIEKRNILGEEEYERVKRAVGKESTMVVWYGGDSGGELLCWIGTSASSTSSPPSVVSRNIIASAMFCSSVTSQAHEQKMLILSRSYIIIIILLVGKVACVCVCTCIHVHTAYTLHKTDLSYFSVIEK